MVAVAGTPEAAEVLDFSKKYVKCSESNEYSWYYRFSICTIARITPMQAIVFIF